MVLIEGEAYYTGEDRKNFMIKSIDDDKYIEYEVISKEKKRNLVRC